MVCRSVVGTRARGLGFVILVMVLGFLELMHIDAFVRVPGVRVSRRAMTAPRMQAASPKIQPPQPGQGLGLIEGVGSKQALQELCQFLFDGQNPFYLWKDDKALEITVSNNAGSNILYSFKLRGSGVGTTNASKKRQEVNASKKMFEYLEGSEKYSVAVRSWLSKRLNRDNSPRLMHRSALFEAATSKRCVIFVDSENIPDFRSNFYIDSSGQVRFLSPEAPQPLTAPSLANDEPRYAYGLDYDSDVANYRLGLEWERSPNTGYSFQGGRSGRGAAPSGGWRNEDILILVYAHERGAQAGWANRLTQDYSKNAADVMIMLDLGALQLCDVQSILLITDDKFGQSCRSYFQNDRGGEQDAGGGKASKVSKHFRTPHFQLERTCKAGTVYVGRIPLKQL